MARSPKFPAEQKEKLIKKTKKLSAQEAAAQIGISVQALYAWRKASADAKATNDTAPASVEKIAAEPAVVAPKAEKPKAKAKVNVNVSKVIKAVGSIQSSLNTIETYLKTLQVA